MAHRYFQVYIHLVWRTKYGSSILQGDLELFVHESIRTFAKVHRLDTLAINSAWNHTHSLFGWHPCVAIADVVREFKSRVGTEWNAGVDAGLYTGPRLQWQIGYGAVSIRRHEIPLVCQYIVNQKRHHANSRLSDEFERITECEVSGDLPVRGGASGDV